ncbi:MAG: hypothetical protein WCO23_04950 [bacterium]
MKEKQKTILLLLNGLGISLGMNGNAVAAAKPAIFSKLWHENFHQPISPNIGQNSMTPETQYLSFVTGENVTTGYNSIAKSFHESIWEDNKAILATFDYSKRHNSAINLIGTISKHNFDKKIKVFHNLFKIAGKHALYNIRLHLFIDNDFDDMDDLGNHLAKIERLIGTTRIGEIATVMGKNFVSDFTAQNSMIQKSFQVILKSTGKKYLSISQGLAHWQHIKPEQIEPTSFVSNVHSVTHINSFDSIFFFDFEFAETNKLLSLFLSQRSIAVVDKNLRHLNLASLVSPLIANRQILNTAFPLEQDENLLEEISRANRKTSFYSEDYRYQLYHGLLMPDKRFDHEYIVETPRKMDTYGQHYQKLTQSIFDKAIKDMQSDMDFLLIDVPMIERLCDLGDYKKVVEGIKFLDGCIERLKSAILENGDVLIIASLYGMAEAMKWQNFPETGVSFCQLSQSPVPFIVLNGESAKQNKRHIIHEIASSNHHVSDLGKNILHLIGVNNQHFGGKIFAGK